MGCDGGTIPRRDELVRKKKKPEQKDKDAELSFRWQHCAITQEPLQKPIVACGLGRLYNKDAVIEMLLDKSNSSGITKHIKSLKDVKELQLTPNPEYKSSADKGDAYIDRQTSPYICPVIGLEMNGKFRFIFLWKCGCVMSERALKQVKTKVCHNCQQSFEDDDVIILNGEEADVTGMQVKLEIRQVHLKFEKKLKSQLKSKSKIVSVNDEGSSSSSSPPLLSSSSGSASTSSVNGKVAPKLKRGSDEIHDPAFKKTKSSYSVSEDPSATEVYKSLFTSHPKAVSQSKAHWITYNPFYN